MKLSLVSMSSNMLEEVSIVEVSRIKAAIEVTYSNYEDLFLNYLITVIYEQQCLYKMELKYKISKKDVNNFSDLLECLDKAVVELQERIEIILGLITEEVGYKLV